MKWLVDTTGRFGWRPYYTQDEMETICEREVSGFLKRKYGECRFPLSTDDMTIMIEHESSSLDLYADLTGEGRDIEGLTDFYSHKKPAVRIARELSANEAESHRLRFTLAHEYAHIKLHSFLWGSVLSEEHVPSREKQILSQRGKYRKMLSRIEPVAARSGRNYRLGDCSDEPEDWMEWQASYAAAAILMPLSPLKSTAETILNDSDRHWAPSDTPDAHLLVASVAGTFDVSPDTAKDRLLNLGLLRATD